MTNEKLKKATALQKEIEELEMFIWYAQQIWTGKIIKREIKYIFKANGYGAFNDKEYNLSYAMKDKLLLVLQEHLKEMKEELSKI